MNTNVTISEQARALAEERARQEGFASVDDYVDALIREDKEESSVRGWMRRHIEEGLASPSAGELTRSKLDRLVSEGVARIKSKT
jgi:Arc/MetJ-type ribon-helix-helix transcriptional regulator